MSQEESLLKAIQQRSLAHDISRIEFHRPQTKQVEGEAGNKYEQQADRIANLDISRIEFHRPQTKQVEGEAGNKYEQQADRIANLVMGRSQPTDINSSASKQSFLGDNFSHPVQPQVQSGAVPGHLAPVITPLVHRAIAQDKADVEPEPQEQVQDTVSPAEELAPQTESQQASAPADNPSQATQQTKVDHPDLPQAITSIAPAEETEPSSQPDKALENLQHKQVTQKSPSTNKVSQSQANKDTEPAYIFHVSIPGNVGQARILILTLMAAFGLNENDAVKEKNHGGWHFKDYRPPTKQELQAKLFRVSINKSVYNATRKRLYGTVITEIDSQQATPEQRRQQFDDLKKNHHHIFQERLLIAVASQIYNKNHPEQPVSLNNVPDNNPEWDAILDRLLRDRHLLNGLPNEIKQKLGGQESFDVFPHNYQQLLSIARKLNKFPPALLSTVQPLEKGNQDAEAERRKAEEKAEAERQKANQEPKGFFGWLADKAQAFFEGIKKAIQTALEAARAAVKAVIETAQKLATAVIEAARKVIVAVIKAVGEALIAIGDLLLAAFPKLRDRFRNAIKAVVKAAEAAVNFLAETLKKGLQAVLNLLGKALNGALKLLENCSMLAVDLVKAAVQGAISAAQAIVNTIGAFAVLIKDIAANPGQWLHNFLKIRFRPLAKISEQTSMPLSRS